MKHTQYTRELNRRLFQSEAERRVEAVVDFIVAAATAALVIGLMLAIGVILAWRG